MPEIMKVTSPLKDDSLLFRSLHGREDFETLGLPSLWCVTSS